ncbi:DNA-binding protein HU [Sulfitobacter noctilucicola]|uniref:DNA-binding protein HU-alpha n=1 Tax=Sulfitobacter noctilucicola TaxID=1342301 RepID=A0A7W6MB01_9RHOB|nr:HU family DNA-binding protein [Sulfitobacter noctilucicola]KIN66391.1 DNA-binding protein HU [Sulfitobacter noctilucicola]MBB4175740.1 DNA-binding protein HU-alpha [Sulfitobacter noctilucicola]
MSVTTSTKKKSKTTTTSTSKTSAAKTTTAKPKAADPAPVSAVTGDAPAAAKAAEPTIVDAPQPVIVGPMLRKKELVDTVVARSGLKKKDVKPAVEMVLTVLGEALGDNRDLNLPPLGRIKVRREKTLKNGRVVTAKIRQSTPPEKPASADITDSESDY